MDCSAHLRDLNVGQRAAVEYGVGGGTESEISGPLLVIAAAGTGKTNTLAHRVAHLILGGASPERILLLTFTRRAAAEMTARAQRILTAARAAANGRRAAPGRRDRLVRLPCPTPMTSNGAAGAVPTSRGSPRSRQRARDPTEA